MEAEHSQSMVSECYKTKEQQPSMAAHESEGYSTQVQA